LKPLGQANYEQFADRFAERAAVNAYNACYERPATLSLLPDVNRLRVLDAGCGPGLYAEWMAKRGARVIAIDVTPEMVALTRDRLGNRASVRQADLDQPLDFLDGACIDLVVCPLVLDYVEEWEPVFREFERVLVPGGTLVFSCEHPHSNFEFCRRRMGLDSNYFAVERYELEWSGFGEPKPTIRSFRRSLGDILNPLLQSGLLLDTILEPKPAPEFELLNADDYARLHREPCFLCVRGRKPAAGNRARAGTLPTGYAPTNRE